MPTLITLNYFANTQGTNDASSSGNIKLSDKRKIDVYQNEEGKRQRTVHVAVLRQQGEARQDEFSSRPVGMACRTDKGRGGLLLRSSLNSKTPPPPTSLLLNKRPLPAFGSTRTGIPILLQNDVLSGKGKGVLHHAGNKNYRAIVAKWKPEYTKTKTHEEKDVVASEVIKELRSLRPPANF